MVESAAQEEARISQNAMRFLMTTSAQAQSEGTLEQVATPKAVDAGTFAQSIPSTVSRPPIPVFNDARAQRLPPPQGTPTAATTIKSFSGKAHPRVSLRHAAYHNLRW